MTKSTYQEIITKPELNFWTPIITSVVLITLSWANFSTELKLLRREVESLVKTNETLLQKYTEVETRWGYISQRVTVLETKAGIK